jgi:hypothetical protein
MSRDATSEASRLKAELGELLARSNLRSADRAGIQAMLKKVRRGEPLSYQEYQNFWAYCNRYGVPVSMTRRPAP